MEQSSQGPAERLVQSLTAYADHMYHGRPGLVWADGTEVGARWEPGSARDEGGLRIAYRSVKAGPRKTNRVRVGVLGDDGKVRDAAGRVLCEFREPGVFPEVAVWAWRKVAEVWRLDNEFAAKWASWAFAQDHKDMKALLAAFMLVQSRKGDPERGDDGKVAFYDEDYRDVGEAMVLLPRQDDRHLRPKDLVRMHAFLSLPGIAAANRELGFSRSARNPQYGRWHKAVEKWLRYRERNPRVLEGLVKSGWRTSIMELVRLSKYKPEGPKFLEILRWRQVQAKDGRRTVAIGAAVRAAETWAGLSEEEVCERIAKEQPSWKVITGLLPGGVTAAIMAAAVESGCLSNKDLVIATPTLEELGLLTDTGSATAAVRTLWANAVKEADDMRAANIATRVRSKAVQERLQEGADAALQKAVEKAVKGLRTYFIVDISGSMTNAIGEAKRYIAKFLQGFPPASLHVSVFNTYSKELEIKHPSAAGVEQAFRGISAGGGTDYGAGVQVLQHHKPLPEEDAIFFFVGDEEAHPFTQAVRDSGLNPVAFLFLKVREPERGYAAVHNTAAALGIPCAMVDEKMFEDPYALPRVLPALIASTPVGATARTAAAPRVTLVEQILRTDLLVKPSWAA